jgi:DNA helicase INO80
MSHHYSNKIAKIPWPPIHARSRDMDLRDQSPFLERTNGHEHGKDTTSLRPRNHSRRFSSGAEDAAHEFERSVLEDFNDAPVPRTISRQRKGKEVNKRLASDTYSDIDMPSQNQQPGPAPKKRKLQKNIPNAEEEGRSTEAEIVTQSTVLKLSKGKGKVKQLQREVSYESISVTPKPARRKGPKKKLGLAPEIESELAASHPPSASGDATPSISRPPSPAATTSTIVYELHEHIPPLKKAKKIDDNGMLKRVKALEEAQRKVWTNIARRDISKVRTAIYFFVICS